MLSSQAFFPNFPAVSLTISPSYLKLSMVHLNPKVNFFKFSYVKPFTIHLPFHLHQDEYNKIFQFKKRKPAMIFVSIHLTQQIENTRQCKTGKVLDLCEEGKQCQIFRKTYACFYNYHCSKFYVSHRRTVLSGAVGVFCK